MHKEEVFIKGFIFPGLILAGLISSCSPNSDKNQIRNIVVLVGDDHTSEVVGVYGNDIVRTPNIDRLASRSVVFTTAYSNAPVCSASRQSLLTGKYPHSTGVTLLQTAFRDSGNVTLAEILRANGYNTAVIGKTHFNNYNDEVPPDHGFDLMISNAERNNYLKENPMPPIPDSIKTLGKWRPFQDPATVWLNAGYLPSAVWSEYGSAAWDAKNAVGFLEDNKDSKFLMWVGFHEPHSPFNFPVEYAGKYNPSDMPVPEGSPEDDRHVPEIFRDLSHEEKQGIIASYYTSVEYMDENIGKILDAIENLGLSENTLIIYIGDQGYLLGEHKRFEKHSMWEEAVKAPLIVYSAGLYGEALKNDALVQFVDLTPTILDIVNIPSPDEVQGKSLKPLLTGQKSEVNDIVFSEFLVDNLAMVCDKDWKYMFTSGERDLGQGYSTGYGPTGVLHRLYNLNEDPKETTNLAGKPEHTDVLLKMQEEMLQIFLDTHPKAHMLPENLSMDEKLSWFCIPPDENANLDAK